jgi:RimJ/RimL family protein N-acetyltransferase
MSKQAVFNQLGQPIGWPVDGWVPRPRPVREAMVGRSVTVTPFAADDHAADLHAANSLDIEGRMWTYLAVGPFGSLDEYRPWAENMTTSSDPLFHAIVDNATGKPIGAASFLRIEPAVGVIEVGHIAYSALLQKTRGATEAMYLMMCRVFDELGYRRYEWKCDLLNEPSRRAAERLGFSFEGVFRQALVYKGRNRDTAWYSMLDHEWPAIKAGYEAWLAPSNFDGSGNQKTSLSVRLA